jgi:oligosaccharide translocation protein RFT1
MGELRTDTRVRAEGFGTVMKSVVTFFILFAEKSSAGTSADARWALVAFACGQLTYASTILGVYLFHYRFSVSLWPEGPAGEALGETDIS